MSCHCVKTPATIVVVVVVVVVGGGGVGVVIIIIHHHCTVTHLQLVAVAAVQRVEQERLRFEFM
jgi:hypothetical protein